MALKLGNTTIAGATIQLGQPLNVGQVIPSAIPLIDAGLHLFDGTLILGGGIYNSFVTYMSGLASNNPELFTTEANWQSAVLAYGICDKFVYDSVNNTVRLPKWGNQAITKNKITTATTLPVKGNGMNIGLTNGTVNAGLGGNNGLLGITTGSYGSTLPAGGGQEGGLMTGQAIGLTNDSTKSGIITDISSLTNEYGCNCYYYIVIATCTKTEIESDIDEIATDLNGKADTDLTNLTSTATPNFDSRWVASAYTLYNNTSLSSSGSPGRYTTSLASYLPNDGYNYEVIFRGGTDTSNPYNIMIDTDFAGNHGQFYNASNYGNRAHFLILIFGANRTLGLNVYTSVDHFSLYAVAYRRIGTNA